MISKLVESGKRKAESRDFPASTLYAAGTAAAALSTKSTLSRVPAAGRVLRELLKVATRWISADSRSRSIASRHVAVPLFALSHFRVFAIKSLFLLPALCALVAAPAHGSTFTQVQGLIGGIKSGGYARSIVLTSSRQGRPVMGVIITDPHVPVGGKTRIVIVAGQHGDEPHPALSMARLAARWSSEPAFEELRRKSIVLIIPDANPDGLARGTRRNSAGADMNRDWDDLSQPETQAISHVIGLWKPHLLIDEHEWSSTDGRRANCVELSQPSGSRDLVSVARRVRFESVSSAFAQVDSQPGRDTSLLHRHFGEQGYLAYLVETRPEESSARKRQLYFAVTLSLARQAISNRRAIEAASTSDQPYQVPAPAARVSPKPTGIGVAIALVCVYCLVLACGRKNNVPAEVCTVSGLMLPELTYRSWINRRARLIRR